MLTVITMRNRPMQSAINQAIEDLQAVDIIPKDDAFHRSMNLVDVEWWYFDAIFDNGYSVFLGIRTIHMGKSGIVMSRIEVYDKRKVVYENLQTNLFRDFQTSFDVPFVKLSDRNIIEFDQEYYKKTGDWRYKVTFSIGKNKIDLVFTGITKGWKIETPKNSWAVALPKADVRGTITIEGITIPVQGIGYHDHNWDYSFLSTSFTKIGWYWGRIIGNTMNIIWAKTIETPEKSNLVTIVNGKKETLSGRDFLTINPANISFTEEKFILNHRRWTPIEFILRIKDTISGDQIPVDINVVMKGISSKHSKIFTAHYWRYHMQISGTISIGSHKETMKDAPQIVEFLSFKSQGRKYE